MRVKLKEPHSVNHRLYPAGRVISVPPSTGEFLVKRSRAEVVDGDIQTPEPPAPIGLGSTPSPRPPTE